MNIIRSFIIYKRSYPRRQSHRTHTHDSVINSKTFEFETQIIIIVQSILRHWTGAAAGGPATRLENDREFIIRHTQKNKRIGCIRIMWHWHVCACARQAKLNTEAWTRSQWRTGMHARVVMSHLNFLLMRPTPCWQPPNEPFGQMQSRKALIQYDQTIIRSSVSLVTVRTVGWTVPPIDTTCTINNEVWLVSLMNQKWNIFDMFTATLFTRHCTDRSNQISRVYF